MKYENSSRINRRARIPPARRRAVIFHLTSPTRDSRSAPFHGKQPPSARIPRISRSITHSGRKSTSSPLLFVLRFYSENARASVWRWIVASRRSPRRSRRCGIVRTDLRGRSSSRVAHTPNSPETRIPACAIAPEFTTARISARARRAGARPYALLADPTTEIIILADILANVRMQFYLLLSWETR